MILCFKRSLDTLVLVLLQNKVLKTCCRNLLIYFYHYVLL